MAQPNINFYASVHSGARALRSPMTKAFQRLDPEFTRRTLKAVVRDTILNNVVIPQERINT